MTTMPPLSNLTNDELYRLTGTLPSARIEALIETAELYEKITGSEAHIIEARGSYPDEGFLYHVIERLNAVAKSVRGDNRQEILSIVSALEQIDQDVTNDAEYGRDELRKALKDIKQGTE